MVGGPLAAGGSQSERRVRLCFVRRCRFICDGVALGVALEGRGIRDGSRAARSLSLLTLLPDLLEDCSYDRQQEQANKPSLHVVPSRASLIARKCS